MAGLVPAIHGFLVPASAEKSNWLANGLTLSTKPRSCAGAQGLPPMAASKKQEIRGWPAQGRP
jgi:hypothetical protein